MNWEAVGAVAELVGAVAVIVSLIYLASQVRVNSRQVLENSRHVQASIYHSTNSAFIDWFNQLAQNEELSAMWGRVMAGERLEDLDKIRTHALLTSLFLSFESNFQQQNLGVVSRETFELQSLRDLMRTPAIATWWQLNGPRIFTQAFQKEIARIQAELTKSGDHSAASA